MAHLTRQVEIIHLSDLHFGREHKFAPFPTPDGDIPSREGWPKLIDKLLEDFDQLAIGYPLVRDDMAGRRRRKAPLLICITGDFATTGSRSEFDQAKKFIAALESSDSPRLGLQERARSIFIVPGNHDVLFEEEEIGDRWSVWARFFYDLYGTNVPVDEPWGYVQLHQLDDIGVLVLCLNSEIHVRKGTTDEHRGQLDEKQLRIVENSLREIPPDELKAMIRIALVHHHPVLIPTLAEPGRGYDSIVNAGRLLTILRRYGFHLILHGHKHFPHTFLEDVRNGFNTVREQPMVVVAGGSVGSKGLPPMPSSTTCYNRIAIKWQPGAGYTRIKVVTRGLETYYPDLTDISPYDWTWKTLREDDRYFSTARYVPDPVKDAWQLNTHSQIDMSDAETRRKQEYETMRGNMAFVDVRPSLVEGQVSEARFWIVGHRDERRVMPEEVIWSAGPKFPVVSIRREDDPRFCATYHYYGSMLIQAQLKFSDGPPAYTYVYASVPEDSS